MVWLLGLQVETDENFIVSNAISTISLRTNAIFQRRQRETVHYDTTK